jgi:hypothetical protein
VTLAGLVAGALVNAGAVLPGAAPAFAGAWVQDAGAAYLRLSGGYLSTHERYDGNGDRAPVDEAGGGVRHTRYDDLSMTLYAEVGVAPGWNAVGSLTWKSLRTVQPAAEFSTWGLADGALGVKRALSRGPGLVSALGVYAVFPTGYDETEYPALGSGVLDVSLLGEGGRSFGAFWITGEAGFTLRGGAFQDQARGALGGGWGTGRLGLRGEARGAVAVEGSGEGTNPGSGTSFDPTAEDASNLDLAGVVSVKVLWGVALEAEVRGTVAGENTLAGTRWSLAMATNPAWRWNP